MATRPLRTVVLYSSGHVGSAAIVNAVARWREVALAGIVRADTVHLDGLEGLARVRRQCVRTGRRFAALLAWQRAVQAVAYAIGAVLPGRRRLRPARAIAAEAAIPELATADVNGDAARAWIAAQAPDLLISACFPQILRPAVIALPRLGVLNVHPGWLPGWRGAMAYFWPLRHGVAEAGATVHWIDAGIDTGPILARRGIRVRSRDTQQTVMTRACTVGARLLRRVVRQLARGEVPRPLPVAAEPAAYFPMPGRADFLAYFARRRFFRIRDVMATLLRPARG